jgi:hypothetical protein
VATAVTRPPLGLFIDPTSHHFEGDRLFDPQGNATVGDQIHAPYVHLRSWFEAQGIPVHTADLLDHPDARCEHNVYLSFGIRHRWPKLVDRSDVVLSGFFALECPIVEPKLYLALSELAPAFRRLYSFSDGDSLRPFLRGPLVFESFRIPQSFNKVHDELWSRQERRLLTMINANKLPRLYVHELYTERLRAIEHFSTSPDFDLFGNGWDQPPWRTGATRTPYIAKRALHTTKRYLQHVLPDRQLAAARRVWRGAVANKAEVLAGYHFALCFENMILPGWITEKMFDCFFSGTIPVYLGAPDITQWVPSECFVDMRDFADYDALSDHLLAMSPHDRQAMRDAARTFLMSPAYAPFTKEAFRNLIATIVQRDTEVQLSLDAS